MRGMKGTGKQFMFHFSLLFDRVVFIFCFIFCFLGFFLVNLCRYCFDTVLKLKAEKITCKESLGLYEVIFSLHLLMLPYVMHICHLTDNKLN